MGLCNLPAQYRVSHEDKSLFNEELLMTPYLKYEATARRVFNGRGREINTFFILMKQLDRDRDRDRGRRGGG